MHPHSPRWRKRGHSRSAKAVKVHHSGIPWEWIEASSSPVFPALSFLPGLSLARFLESFGTEETGEKALETVPSSQGRPKCGDGDQGCHHQTTLTAGTIMESTKLFFRTWLVPFHFIR
jgi:hypothetical protein